METARDDSHSPSNPTDELRSASAKSNYRKRSVNDAPIQRQHRLTHYNDYIPELKTLVGIMFVFNALLIACIIGNYITHMSPSTSVTQILSDASDYCDKQVDPLKMNITKMDHEISFLVNQLHKLEAEVGSLKLQISVDDDDGDDDDDNILYFIVHKRDLKQTTDGKYYFEIDISSFNSGMLYFTGFAGGATGVTQHGGYFGFENHKFKSHETMHREKSYVYEKIISGCKNNTCNGFNSVHSRSNYGKNYDLEFIVQYTDTGKNAIRIIFVNPGHGFKRSDDYTFHFQFVQVWSRPDTKLFALRKVGQTNNSLIIG